jgi:hypothetical protein
MASFRPRTLSNASSTATLEAAPVSPPTTSQQWPQSNGTTCHSPIFNYIENLRLDETTTLNSLDDDLDDINIIIDTEVGFENLPKREDEMQLTKPSSTIMQQQHQGLHIFQPVEINNKIKVCL